MGRVCADCGQYRSCSCFSRNQWTKGNGWSRCMDCVDGVSYAPSYQCAICSRTFTNQNNLDMHMQVHRSRNVSCPVCGETRFKSGANAVQHVESGFCSGCRGEEHAREQIYRFAQSKKSMSRFMTDAPQLTYGNWNSNNQRVPDFPYQCPDCSKAFRQMSQLLQHQDQKHRQHNLLGY
ncbi:zinc finger C2H2 type domain containing protein [Nitzschia inconspicua]|uniref:Zinc finger C2H2 type domain containing protein n=1 Tax=Nitzschia inconspicua TaxID=303405 RepID=A0A9K3LRU2_9STRA|nr:zinc finger C2H2 type domain containing protein [Nitzschia inconspicua]